MFRPRMSSCRAAFVLQALEEEQQRTVPAPFEFVADWADVLQVAMRVGDERLSLTGFGAGFELVEA